jgi:excisionase family DNA binding protein
MTKENKAFPIPGYIVAEEAAQMLGVSKNRLHQYIREGRLAAIRVGKSYLLRAEDVAQFKANPTGRIRTQPPAWRVYKGGGRVVVTEIDVQVRSGQQQQLAEKLQAIQVANQYTFPGTIARYIVQGSEQSGCVHIILVWKTTEMPDEAVRQEYLATFQAELGEMLDWNTAQVQTNQAIIHT